MKEETYFETIKCEDQEVFNLSYHKKRMAKTVGINFNLEEYIYTLNDNLIKCKVIYNKDGIIDIIYSPYSPKKIDTFKLVYNDNIEYKYKSTNRESINDLYEKKEKADEIIIIKNGLVTDTSIANIAIEIDGIWHTPKKPLLAGTTRARYIQEGILKEIDIDINMLKKAKKLALLNAMVDFKILEEFEIID